MWIAGALLVSHGVASWLGKSWPREDEMAGRNTAAAAAAGSVNSSASMPMTLAGLQERVRQRAAEKQAAADELALHPWREQVAAARAKIPAGADLAALVKKGMEEARRLAPVGTDLQSWLEADGWDMVPLSAETCAAYALWLEQDPAAALRWFELNDHGSSTIRVRDEMKLWVQEGGRYRDLARLVAEYPQAAGALRQFAGEAAAQEGPQVLLDLAAGMSRFEDRVVLVYELLDRKKPVAGQIAGMLAVLQEGQGARILLESLSSRADFAENLEEIRTAGFPPGLLAECEKQFAAAQQKESSGADKTHDDERKEIQKTGSLTDQLREEVGLQWWNENYRCLPSSVYKALPEMYQWCQAARDGRIPLEEVMTRARAGWPAVAAQEEELRVLLAWQLMPERPLETLEWLQESGIERGKYPDLSKSHLSIEQISAVLQGYPGGYQLQGDEEIAAVSQLFSDWHGRDPQACLAALEKFPDERVREHASGMIAAVVAQKKTQREEGAGAR
ncbi:hypothetical protein [Haloferula sp. BvORR071]|uniref:hypothetical protein n=1 Tax=Haloferula sp. BvORR071 TaxID=1396141 RepID=UPI00054DD385|nr:hypothetical protein [Haloferula sp. BvORR071]